MLFTIAIPTYNSGNSLAAAIDSCVNQSFKDQYETLIVDNASTDNTNYITKQYEKKVRVVVNSSTLSQFDNHNVCLKESMGEYVVFCHADDCLDYHALDKFLIVLKQRGFPKKFVVWGRSFFRDFLNNWQNGGFNLNQVASGIKSIDVFRLGGLTASGTCYSREEFLNLGGFLEMQDIMTPSDMSTMWMLCVKGFEFEMTDRIYVKRNFASTALLDNRNQVISSISNAIIVFSNNSTDREFSLVYDSLVNFNNLINPYLIAALFISGHKKDGCLKLSLLKFFFKNPLLIFNKRYYFLIYYFFK